MLSVPVNFTFDDYLALFNEKSKYKIPDFSSEEIKDLKKFGKKMFTERENRKN